MVPSRCEADAGSRRGKGDRGDFREWKAAGNPLETTVPDGRDRRAEAGPQPSRYQDHQPLGQPAGWGPATVGEEQVHFHHVPTLYGGYAASRIGPARPCEVVYGHEVVMGELRSRLSNASLPAVPKVFQNSMKFVLKEISF